MELIYTHQIGFEQLTTQKFDYFIVASGYENRCTYLIDIVRITAFNKFVLAFQDKKDLLFRKNNDKRFNDDGFTFIEESPAKLHKIVNLLNSVCSEAKNSDNIKILVDYSCMSKLWYAGILQYLISNEVLINNLELYFSYTSAVFTEPHSLPGGLSIGKPEKLMAGIQISDKPVALVLGLGYEKNLGRKLLNEFNYDTAFAFYSDPAFDNRYTEMVVKNNRRLLKTIPDDHIIKYPVGDFNKTDSLLKSLVLGLRLNYKVVILPTRPKPFTLSSLLLAARYPDIEVWRVNTGLSDIAYNRSPTGEPIVCKVMFSNDEDTFL